MAAPWPQRPINPSSFFSGSRRRLPHSLRHPSNPFAATAHDYEPYRWIDYGEAAPRPEALIDDARDVGRRCALRPTFLAPPRPSRAFLGLFDFVFVDVAAARCSVYAVFP
jgi:hypothetical protein